jgi:hypothetical protein
MEHRVRSQESGVRSQKKSGSTTSHSSASNLQPPTSNEAKPLASISLDLDNKWSYMKTHGDTGWKDFPSYLDIFIPRALDILDSLDLKITFFIVGQDAALDKNRDVLKLLIERGHEVGNHSFHHEPWLHLYSKDQVEKEIVNAEEQIVRVTGEKPVGFRGPGFSWSKHLFEVLFERAYIYDASTLPTYLGPIARHYYFWTSDLSPEEKAERDNLFGSFKDGMRSVKPYYWQLSNGSSLLEIPVTTVPFIKTPFHLSYLLYLSRFSTSLMLFYLKIALLLCRLTRTEPSFLLHPPDLLGGDQTAELSFFPGMDVDTNRKAEIFEKVLRELSRHFTLVNMSFHAQSILKSRNTRVLQLNSRRKAQNLRYRV